MCHNGSNVINDFNTRTFPWFIPYNIKQHHRHPPPIYMCVCALCESVLRYNLSVLDQFLYYSNVNGTTLTAFNYILNNINRYIYHVSLSFLS